MSSSKREFKRVNIHEQYVDVKRLSLGGQIQKDDDCFEAIDNFGNFLGGLIASQENAEYAAQQGFVVNAGIDSASELDLWLVWNSAVAMNCRVMQDQNGVQVMHIGNGVYMTVQKYESGWAVELLSDLTLEQYYLDAKHECFELRVITNKSDKFVLE